MKTLFTVDPLGQGIVKLVVARETKKFYILDASQTKVMRGGFYGHIPPRILKESMVYPLYESVVAAYDAHLRYLEHMVNVYQRRAEETRLLFERLKAEMEVELAKEEQDAGADQSGVVGGEIQHFEEG